MNTEFPNILGDGLPGQNGRRPSILFINQHYWPDFASTGQHLTDLAEHLAAAGYDVHVLCSRGGYLAGKLRAPASEVHRGVSIRRVGGTAFGRNAHLGRLADYGSFYLRVILRLLIGRRFDLVVPLTTPPILAAATGLAKAVRGQHYGIWSMDLHPDAEFALGMLKSDSVFGRLLEGINRWGYREADFVVDLGACMKARLVEKGVSADRLHTIPVWSRADEVVPIPPSQNPLRDELGLAGKFVVMYSGNAGLAHCFEEVLSAARDLQEHEDIKFVFVGGGPRRGEVEAFAAENRLTNLRYLDYFPRDQIRWSLPLGDVHLLTLRDDFAGIAVPGKLYGIMAAGRPVFMVGPRESAPGQTILEQDIGEVIPPGSENGGERLAESIYAYYTDPGRVEAAGRRARKAFLDRYEQTVACKMWAAQVNTFLRKHVPDYRNAFLESHTPAVQPSLYQPSE